MRSAMCLSLFAFVCLTIGVGSVLSPKSFLEMAPIIKTTDNKRQEVFIGVTHSKIGGSLVRHPLGTECGDQAQLTKMILIGALVFSLCAAASDFMRTTPRADIIKGLAMFLHCAAGACCMFTVVNVNNGCKPVTKTGQPLPMIFGVGTTLLLVAGWTHVGAVFLHTCLRTRKGLRNMVVPVNYANDKFGPKSSGDSAFMARGLHATRSSNSRVSSFNDSMSDSESSIGSASESESDTESDTDKMV